jgi:tetratricopeptide (TPR) repeat protein
LAFQNGSRTNEVTLILQKRILSFLSVMLVTSCLTCTGVGDENLFLIEQLHYKAEKLKQKKLGIKPELLTETDYNEMIDAYMSVVNTFELNYGELAAKDTLSSSEREASYLAGRSLIEAAFLHERKGEDSVTIEILGRFAREFPHNREQRALALLQLGRRHARTGHLDKTEAAWMELLEEYFPPADRELHPNTEILELPVTLARLYYDLQDTEKGEQHLDFAERYYLRIIDEFRHSPLGLTTIRFLADTYVLRNKPSEAITLLETATDSAGAVFGTAQLIIADIYLTSLGDTAKARERYEAVAESEVDSLSHPQAFMQMAKLEFMHGNFPECRKHAATLKNRFERYRSLQPQVQQLVARSFDKEGDFSRAFSEYQWVLTNFPDSKEAIDTYRYLPRFLRENDQEQLAAEWHGKAVAFLSDMKQEAKGTTLGLAAHSNLINMLIESEKWSQTIRELELLQADYPLSTAGSSALARAGSIYRDKLQDMDKARGSYERQLNLYPDLPISEEVRLVLRELENSK